jgi:hypothetical protein
MLRSRYLLRVPQQNFSGAENAVVGVVLIAFRLGDAPDLVSRYPSRPRLAGSSHADEDRNTGNPVMAPLVWLVADAGAGRFRDRLGNEGRIVMGMVPGAPSW